MWKATDYVCHPHVHQPETKRLTTRAWHVFHTQHTHSFQQLNNRLRLLCCLQLLASSKITKEEHSHSKVKTCSHSNALWFTKQEWSFQKMSTRREVWQYHFLCLSVCETAAHASVTAWLIFTELPASCTAQRCRFSSVLMPPGRGEQYHSR